MGYRRLRRPSAAFVVSTLALALAMTGGSLAASGALTKKGVTKIVKTQIKVLAPTLSVKHAKSAAHAISASSATNATNATSLQGRGPGSFATSRIEAPHVVGATGQPQFENGWGATNGSDESVSFYKDPWGIVHLQGSADAGGSPDSGTVFTLPAGYRPANGLYFSAYGIGGSSAFVEVDSSGNVTPKGPATPFIGLSGVSFRAGT